MSTSGGDARLVNDEGVLSARSLTLESPGDVLGHFVRKAAKSNRFAAEDEILKLQEKFRRSFSRASPCIPTF